MWGEWLSGSTETIAVLPEEGAGDLGGGPTEWYQSQFQIEEHTDPAGGNLDPEGSPVPLGEGLFQFCFLIAVEPYSLVREYVGP